MAPIKFEEDIKNRLEKRTIKPSDKSWDTLSQRLDNKENKGSKKGYWWLGIAASIVGLLLVSNFFLNRENENNQENNIVEENTIIDSLKIETPKLEIIVENEEKAIETKAIKINKTVIKTSKYIASNNNSNSKKNKKLIVKNDKISTALILDKKTTDSETVIANTKNLINTKTSVTDNELDLLLTRATQDIAMQQNNSKTIPIDYNGLLIDVEDDLDETIRDKMFKAVKKGYSSIKESVAERND